MAIGLVALPLLAATPVHADASTQWALSYLKFSQVNALSTGNGVTVGLIDSGIQPIPDIIGQLVPGADFSGLSDTTSSGAGEEDTDPEGHGNGMASIIAGQSSPVQGLAPQAKVMPIRNMLASGEAGGPNAPSSSIHFAIDQHLKVINISEGWANSTTDQEAISAAANADIVVVVSAGNSSSTVSGDSQPAPAEYPGVVVVGAVDQTGKIAPFSDYGPQITLTAPGVDILNDQGYANDPANASGTSPAAAYVSATAALIFSEHPTWTAGQVIRDMISTADPGAGQIAGQHDDHYGYGIVDPLKALQAAAPAETTNPLLAAATVAPTAGGGAIGSGSSDGAPAPASSSGSGAASSALVIGLGVLMVLVVLVAAVILTRRGKRGRGN